MGGEKEAAASLGSLPYEAGDLRRDQARTRRASEEYFGILSESDDVIAPVSAENTRLRQKTPRGSGAHVVCSRVVNELQKSVSSVGPREALP